MNTDETFVELAYDMNFAVRYGEVGSDGVATLSSVGNWLQESAGLSAETLGFGENDMLPLGKTWILARLVLRIDRLPVAGEHLHVHTWPSTLDHFGTRGYEIYDEDGKLILSGGSAWAVMNIHDRTLTSIPEPLAERYPTHPRPCDSFACRVIPRLRGEAQSCLLRVRRDDLDINGHVNNTRYLAWLMEALPARDPQNASAGDARIPHLVDITFRSECFPQEDLKSLYAPVIPPAGVPSSVMGKNVPYALLHSIQRISDGNEVCRALTLWDTPPDRR